MQVDSLLNNITRNMEMMEIESEMRFFKGSFMQIDRQRLLFVVFLTLIKVGIYYC